MTDRPLPDGGATIAHGLSAEARALLGRRARADPGAVSESAFGTTFAPSASSPLSSWQRSIWFFDQMGPGGDAYHCAKRLRLRGPLDLPAMEKALGEVFRRHEVLRSRVDSDAGNPVQRLVPDFRLPLKIIALDMLALSDRQARYVEVADAENHAPFNLATGPFARVALIRLSDEEHVLLFTAHHIAFDGWSTNVFFRELGELYSAFAAGQLSPVPELKFQYTDFVAWQTARIASKSINDDVTYWIAQMAGAPPLLELPADRPRPIARSHAAGRASLLIPADLADRLRALGRNEGATLFMTMLAAFQLLVARLAGKDDIVLGIPVAGRTKVETETMLGCFINMLPLRTHVSSGVSFRELLASVRRTAVEAYAHQELPFDVLVQHLQPERTLSHTPVTQVLFNFRNTPAPALLFRGLDAAIEPGPVTSVISDFELEIEQGMDGLNCVALYSAELFDTQTVERWLRHFHTLLRSIIAKPDEHVLRLPLLSASERSLILADWNAVATPPDYETCLHQLVEAQVRSTPNAIAVVGGESSLTYRELNRRANRLARDLSARGVGPEVLVGICMERCPEFIIALLAVLKAGGAYLPLDPSYPVGRLAFMLADSCAPVLLTQRGLAGELVTESVRTIYIDALSSNNVTILDEIDDDVDIENLVTPHDLAYVTYTSGSTGRPKGAMNLHRAVCNAVLRSRERHGIVATDVVLHRTPFSFDPSVWEIFTALSSGARLVLASPHGHADPDHLTGLIEKHGITVMNVVPSVLQVLLDVPELSRRCRSLRIVACGGEALSTALQERFFTTLTTTLHNLYGPTETAVSACVWECDPRTTRTTVPIGRGLANLRTYVLDAEGEPVPIGVTGELYIGGVGVGRGYLNHPELTAERFIPDRFSGASGARLYRSGDLVRFDPEGVIEFLGRADFQLKLRGVRIELGEIEAALVTAGGVRECLVVAHEGEPGDVRLIAYVVPNAGQTLSELGLREHLRATLLPQMIPSAFMMLDSLPVTPNGKVDRRALPAPDTRPKANAGPPAQARTRIEVVVMNAWVDVLKTDQLGIDDDFFELGGHSLNATQVMMRLRTTTGVDLPLRLLFENPTIAGLAAAVAAHSMRDGATSVAIAADTVLRGERDRAPLSFAQERMWLVDQLEPGNTAYIIGCTLRLTGKLDVPALQSALIEIVRRHAVLRTTFATEAGTPIQIVHPAIPFVLPATELVSVPEPTRSQRLFEIEKRDAELPFDLSVDSPIRFRLIELGAEDHCLLVSAHHIAMDGWSLKIFVKELGALYGAFSRGEASPLSELAWQYADFAAWQRDQSKGVALESVLAYWRTQLDDAPPMLGLPIDHPRPSARTFNGATESVCVAPQLAQSIAALGRSEGATVFMTMLAAFQLLVSRLAGEDDVVLGVPIAGRTRVETETMLGCFLNTLPLRTRLGGIPSFRGLLRVVREACVDAYANQDISFDLLIEQLRPQRNLSHAPFFQVLFNMLNIPGSGIELPGLSVKRREGAEAMAKFDLTVYLEQRPDGIELRLVYNTDLFSEKRAAGLLQQYIYLLTQIVAEADAPIGSYSLVPPAHAHVLPDPTALLSASWVGSIPELFAAHAKRTPDRAAVIGARTEWTYRELEERSNQLAHHLRTLGAGPGEVVAIYAQRSGSLVWALMSVLKTGAAFVILDRTYPAAQLAGYVSAARPRVLLRLAEAGALPAEVDRCIAEVAGATRCDIPAFTQTAAGATAWRDYPVTSLDVTLSPDDTAYIAFTSGTTGKPKGIVGRHGSLTHFTSWMASEFGVGPEDRFSLLSGLAHDPLHRDIFTALQLGSSVCVPDPDTVYEPARLAQWICDSGTTVAHLTPALGQLLSSSSAPVVLRGLRLAFFVGDALTRRDVARLHAIAPHVRIVNYYGTTETQRAVSYYVATREALDGDEHRAEALLRKVVPLGRGAPDVQLLVVTPSGQLAGVGELGEVYVRSPHIAKSYLNDEQLSAERFVMNPVTRDAADRCYRTGDLGRYDPDGNVTPFGRADTQVKVRGFRVELSEVEAVLGQHPAVRDTVVVAYSDVSGETRLAAYVIARSDAPDFSELRALLKDRLPSYMFVSSFALLDALPLTPNGKVDRKALPAPNVVASTELAQRSRPQDPVEDELVRLWEELLNVASVGVTDDFFELGGHSLLAVAMMERVATLFGSKPPLSVLFEAPTVEHLARALVASAGMIESRAVCVQAGEPGRAPLFLFHGDFNGGGLYCRRLAHHFDPGQPMYVLGPHQPGGPATIGAMAEDMLLHIQQVQPCGPYLLGGYCNGGLVAVEVARQLVAVGESVDFLAVIATDSRNVKLASLYDLVTRTASLLGFNHRRQVNMFLRLREPALRFLTELPLLDKSSGMGARVGFAVALSALIVRRAVRRAWRASIRGTRLRPRGIVAAGFANDKMAPDERRRSERSVYISRAMFSYIPRSYSGRITVIRAADDKLGIQDDQLQHWRAIGAQVGGFIIPGDHTTAVTLHLDALGAVLRAQMARAS